MIILTLQYVISNLALFPYYVVSDYTHKQYMAFMEAFKT